jgi:hypothetical protein
MSQTPHAAGLQIFDCLTSPYVARKSRRAGVGQARKVADSQGLESVTAKPRSMALNRHFTGIESAAALLSPARLNASSSRR